MKRLIIARHGNTFEDDEPPRRVGCGTDVPLVHSGKAQARAIGQWLQMKDMTPDIAYTSELKRTVDTAEIALAEAGCKCEIRRIGFLNEIDYGPDENKTDADVVVRIGEGALKAWDEKGIVPDGWQFDAEETIARWESFAQDFVDSDHEIGFVVTSNGIARFAPYLTKEFEAFAETQNIKIRTGSICALYYNHGLWTIDLWDERP